MTRLLFAFAALASAASAGVELPSVFSDRMVLQRGAAVPVFGTAEPGAEVTVSFAGQTASAGAGDDGSFKVTLDPLEASGEGRVLTVSSGGEEASINDVLVGEVWVGSGQSNMSWMVQNSLSAEVEWLTSRDDEVRLFKVPMVTAAEPQSDVEAEWKAAGPGTVRDFSAVLYFFGRTIHDAVGVPVGLIQTSWGGTRAEAWTPAEALKAEPELEPILATWDERAANYDAAKADAQHKAAMEKHEQRLAAWKKRRAADAASAGQPPRKPQKQGDPTTDRHRYSTLYNAMVHPLIPYGIRGAVWYQGESNSGRAVQYRTLMATLIKSWRQRWGADFPFYQVQLANFKEPSDAPQESGWAELREAQQIAADAVGNAGVAVITDIGAAKDIHPKDKQNVGHRLARLALVDVYGQDITRSGPTVKDVSVNDGSVAVTFENLGKNGLTGLTPYYNRPLTGFEVAGEDGKYANARAVLKGNDTVVLTSPDVPAPKTVRYNWADNPQGTLFNKAYLPAAPFRTDELPEVTRGVVKP